MSTSDEFFNKMTKHKIVFNENDYNNFMKICNNKYYDNFNVCLKNINDKDIKVSKSFFGKIFVHPKHINPYTVNYKVSDIMWELKLHKQKISDSEKLDKLINYFDYLD